MKHSIKCSLCEDGFPLSGENHIPTQSKGMIPITRCRKFIKRGDIKRYRDYLNDTEYKHENGRFEQRTRQYGDYLYHQDREKFIMEMCMWLPQQM